MDLDEFKITWKTYEQKLDSTERLGQKLLQIVLQNRSKSTIDKMIQDLRLAFAILIGIILFFTAVIAGNAFDYTKPVHYIPACCYLVIAGVGLYFSFQHRANLRKTRLLTHDLYQALLDLIQFHTHHTKLMKRVWMLAMLSGSMVMLPAIAHKFSETWMNTLLIILLPIGLTSLSIGLATLAGMFTDPYLDELRGQLKELDELR
jgi:hypothetical protein